MRHLLRKSICLFLTISITLIFNSCKKTELEYESKYVENKEKIIQFFSNSHNTNPTIGKVINHLQQKTNNELNDIIDYGGFAVWDKVITSENYPIKPFYSQRVESANNDTTVIIPLVLNNQQNVNAFILATINSDSITSTTFLGKDYKKYPYGNFGATNFTAELYAKNLMVLQKHVFDDDRYEIVDKRLFQTNLSVNDTSKQRSLHIKQQANSSLMSRNETNRTYEFCLSVFYFNTPEGCPYLSIGGRCKSDTECDRCGDCGTWVDLACDGSYSGYNPGPSQILIPPPPSGGGGTLTQNNNQTNETGWTPIKGSGASSLNHSTSLNAFVNQLSLSTQETLWLKLNPTFAAEIVSLHNEAMTNASSIKEANGYSEQDIALIATRLTLLDKKFNLAHNGTFTQADYDVLFPYLPSEMSALPYDMFGMYFALEYMRLKIENPTWSETKLYWEASKEVIHILLDGLGLVPVVGEFFDIVNGILYTIDGDYKNATLSYTAAIPGVGWGATAAKYAVKAVAVAVGPKVVKTTFRFFKNAAHKIIFGRVSSQQLRKLHGLLPGDPRQVHHLIPVNICENVGQVVIQKAAGSKNAFHVDDLFNGIPLGTAQHMGSHPNYDIKIQNALNDILVRNGGTNISPDVAYTELVNLTNRIKAALLANPTTKVDDLIF